MLVMLRAVPLLIVAAPAHAHAPAAPGDDHSHVAWMWNADPVVLVLVITLGLLYGVGIVRLWSRAGVDRGVPAWRALTGAVGFAAVAGALISPLDSATEASFALHMAQHAAAPLLVFGNLGFVALTALPAGLRYQSGGPSPRPCCAASARGCSRCWSPPLRTA